MYFTFEILVFYYYIAMVTSTDYDIFGLKGPTNYKSEATNYKTEEPKDIFHHFADYNSKLIKPVNIKESNVEIGNSYEDQSVIKANVLEENVDLEWYDTTNTTQQTTSTQYSPTTPYFLPRWKIKTKNEKDMTFKNIESRPLATNSRKNEKSEHNKDLIKALVKFFGNENMRKETENSTPSTTTTNFIPITTSAITTTSKIPTTTINSISVSITVSSSKLETNTITDLNASTEILTTTSKTQTKEVESTTTKEDGSEEEEESPGAKPGLPGEHSKDYDNILRQENDDSQETPEPQNKPEKKTDTKFLLAIILPIVILLPFAILGIWWLCARCGCCPESHTSCYPCSDCCEDCCADCWYKCCPRDDFSYRSESKPSISNCPSICPSCRANLCR